MNLVQTKSYLDDTAEILTSFDNRRDMLGALVDIGKELPEFPESLRIKANLVKGCASEVWLVVDSSYEENIRIQITAEAFIVKGFVKILLDALDELSLSELLMSRPFIEEFVLSTGLSQSMIATRANAFGNIYDEILEKAKE